MYLLQMPTYTQKYKKLKNVTVQSRALVDENQQELSACVFALPIGSVALYRPISLRIKQICLKKNNNNNKYTVKIYKIIPYFIRICRQHMAPSHL